MGLVGCFVSFVCFFVYVFCVCVCVCFVSGGFFVGFFCWLVVFFLFIKAKT